MGHGHGHHRGQAASAACMGGAGFLVPDLSGSQEDLQHLGWDAVFRDLGWLRGGANLLRLQKHSGTTQRWYVVLGAVLGSP
jgi:hypothetical protein